MALPSSGYLGQWLSTKQLFLKFSESSEGRPLEKRPDLIKVQLFRCYRI